MPETSIRWKTNENFLLRTIGGESVLVPVGEVPDPRFENCMISMNDSSAFLWDLFSAGYKTEQEAVEAALAAYTAAPGEIKAHVRAFVANFERVGLLIREVC